MEGVDCEIALLASIGTPSLFSENYLVNNFQ
jgi:hypothetical protein